MHWTFSCLLILRDFCISVINLNYDGLYEIKIYWDIKWYLDKILQTFWTFSGAVVHISWRSFSDIIFRNWEWTLTLQILWNVDPLLGNISEISNDTTVIVKEWLCKQRPLLGSGWVMVTLEPPQTWMRQWRKKRGMVFHLRSVPRCYK
jgi:hypothetical protein